MSHVRLAKPHDAEDILQIFRSGLPREKRDLTILNCSGVARFLEETIAKPHREADAAFVAYVEDETILGAAEFRHHASLLFLNHIAIHSSARGRGIGTRLLREGIRLVCRPGEKMVGLDVFDDNAQALSWYHHLHFKPASRRGWMKAPPASWAAEHGTGGDWKVGKMQIANEMHSRYGFSCFELRSNGTQYSIGRLGSNYFRITEAAFFAERPAIQALNELDPSRHLFFVGPEDSCEGIRNTTPGFQEIGRTQRMQAALEVVVSRLMANVG